MSEGTWLLVLAYVALTALLITLLLSTRISLLIKVVMALAAFGLYSMSYIGWQSVQGWPTASRPVPARFLLHASVIEEPDPATGDEGVVYVWLSDLVDGRPADQPRAYALPYDKALHADLEEALRNMRNGNVQLGRVSKVTNRPDRPTDLKRLGENRDRITFYDLPDPALPEK
ncbi:MAG: hypothetical protein KDI88_07185 [Gammaproteobacteria bacterium]|nr:hypothetical protein [Gammaproteobacteria bacterium]